MTFRYKIIDENNEILHHGWVKATDLPALFEWGKRMWANHKIEITIGE